MEKKVIVHHDALEAFKKRYEESLTLIEHISIADLAGFLFSQEPTLNHLDGFAVKVAPALACRQHIIYMRDGKKTECYYRNLCFCDYHIESGASQIINSDIPAIQSDTHTLVLQPSSFISIGFTGHLDSRGFAAPHREFIRKLQARLNEKSFNNQSV